MKNIRLDITMAVIYIYIEEKNYKVLKFHVNNSS